MSQSSATQSHATATTFPAVIDVRVGFWHPIEAGEYRANVPVRLRVHRGDKPPRPWNRELLAHFNFAAGQKFSVPPTVNGWWHAIESREGSGEVERVE